MEIKYIKNIIHRSIDDIRNIRIQEISTNGVNSKIYKIKTESSALALKFFRNNDYIDHRRRMLREKSFMELAHKRCEGRVPEIIDSSLEEGWILMSWIEGERATQMNRFMIEETINFIKDLNTGTKDDPGSNRRSVIPLAADNYLNGGRIIKGLEKRIKKLEEIECSCKVGIEAKNWASKDLIPKSKEALKEFAKKLDKSHWGTEQIKTINSPSDVGIHNILRCKKKKKTCYIDFEYAGRDDLSKLIGDIIFHPEHTITSSDAEFIVDTTKSRITKHTAWISRLDDTLEITSLRWCFILLNILSAKEINYAKVKKAINYFNKIEDQLNKLKL